MNIDCNMIYQMCTGPCQAAIPDHCPQIFSHSKKQVIYGRKAFFQQGRDTVGGIRNESLVIGNRTDQRIGSKKKAIIEI